MVVCNDKILSSAVCKAYYYCLRRNETGAYLLMGNRSAGGAVRDTLMYDGKPQKKTLPMHIGFDISQTGSGKAGCGFFAHAMIRSMLELAPEHHYSLFPSFGDFWFARCLKGCRVCSIVENRDAINIALRGRSRL